MKRSPRSKVYWPAGTLVDVAFPDRRNDTVRFKSGVLVTDLLIGAEHVEVRIGRRTEAIGAERLFRSERKR